MALLKHGRYIRLMEDGQVWIYPSLSARQKHKNATSSDVIIQKYQDLLDEYYKPIGEYLANLGLDPSSDTEEESKQLFQVPIISETIERLRPLEQEFCQYEDDLAYQKGPQHDFPIMEQFYPDVKDSIPHITESFFLDWGGEATIEKIYNLAKKVLRFGETEDC